MSRLIRGLGALGLVFLLAGTSVLEAQRPQIREGFWAHVGAGWSTLGCDGCDSREGGTGGALSLGGTLNQKWQLGGGLHFWTKSEDGGTLTVGLLSALAKFYPSSSGGFHLIGGAGVASIDVSFGGFSVSESGSGIILGLGYDIRIGNTISLSPFWNGVATRYDGGDLNFGQLGLGITFH